MDSLKLNHQLQSAYHKGILDGVKLMKNRMLLACENKTPIEINGKAYYIQSDLDHLRQVIRDIGEKTD